MSIKSTPKKNVKNEELAKEYRQLRKEFLLYFDGYTRGNQNAMSKILTLFGNIELLIFGELKH